MGTYILRRLLLTLVVLFFVTLIVFMIIQLLPGDPAQIMLGTDATPEEIEALREEMGLNDPLIVQYFRWLGKAITGDLGTSLFYNQEVLKMIGDRLPITLTIGILAILVTVLLGIPLGVLAAVKRGSKIDSAIVVLANIGVATPNFWLAVVGVYIFSISLGWLPVTGFVSPFEDPVLSFKHLIMPVLILGTSSMASIVRQTRSAMLEVIRQDYIRTARSKGLKEGTIIFRHALRNALIPVVTLLGLSLGNVVGGTVIIETVFNIPGMGRFLVTSIFQKDYIVVQGCVLIIAASVAFFNLVVDVVYSVIDPRIRYD